MKAYLTDGILPIYYENGQKERDYIYSLNEKARDERETKREIREAGIKNYAKEFVEKQKMKKLNGQA